MTRQQFRKIVWDFYKKNGRHDLPWRRTRDPYKILVSEVMLQQTQVERVRPYYEAFVKKFPTPEKLAAAPLGEVLAAWQGLGYNRRAKLLRQAAAAVGPGKFPKHEADLEKLPGVGPYTARAIMAFAYNADVVFIETNIRTAILYHFFTHPSGRPSAPSARAARPIPHLAKGLPSGRVSDREILEVLEKLLPKGKSREWNLALMDYGAHLKKSGVKLNARSKHYTKQSKFAGSNRQARGAILKELAKGSRPKSRLLGLLGDDRRAQLSSALAALQKEGLIQKRGKVFTLPR